jgi:hypothetical protein
VDQRYAHNHVSLSLFCDETTRVKVIALTSTRCIWSCAVRPQDGKKTPRDGSAAKLKGKAGQHIECFGTVSLQNATRAPDGRIIRSTSEADRVSAESREKYEDQQREKRALRARKAQRIGILQNTEAHVKKMREISGIPKDGIRGRQSMGGDLSEESEYEMSDDYDEDDD